MINRIERPLANDHPDGSFSVHLFLHRPKTQNSRIIGQYTPNLLGLKPYPSQFFFSSTKIWIKGTQIGSDMPSALGLVSGAVNIWPSSDTPCNMISFLTCHISFYHISFYTGMPFSKIYFITNHKGCPQKYAIQKSGKNSREK